MLDFMNRLPSRQRRVLSGVCEVCPYDLRQSGYWPLSRYGSFRLLGEVIGQPDYNEVAQRMWASQTSVRMKNHFSRLSDLLLNIGAVLSSRTNAIFSGWYVVRYGPPT